MTARVGSAVSMDPHIELKIETGLEGYRSVRGYTMGEGLSVLQTIYTLVHERTATHCRQHLASGTRRVVVTTCQSKETDDEGESWHCFERIHVQGTVPFELKGPGTTVIDLTININKHRFPRLKDSHCTPSSSTALPRLPSWYVGAHGKHT